MKATIMVLVGIAVGGAFAWMLNIGFDRQEAVECQTWSEQASEYPGFFLLKWQDEQCRAHGIIINAPVK